MRGSADRVQAEHERSMVSTGRPGLFAATAGIYLASADRMDLALANLRSLRTSGIAQVDAFASVVGGLSGLNYLLQLQPRTIALYDVNPAMLGYARLVLEIVSLAGTPREFISRIFCRSVETFLAETDAPELTESNQEAYLRRPVERALLEETQGELSPGARRTHEEVLVPHLTGAVLSGVRNCRRLLPCWPVAARVPVGAGEAEGYDDVGRLVPNTNSFFYGHGWLETPAAYQRVREALATTPPRFVPMDLLAQDLRLLGDLSGRLALHVSNLDEWFPDVWGDRLRRWQAEVEAAQGALTIITSHGGIHRLQSDPHRRAYIGLAPFVYGTVVEVTHRCPWGFHEIPRRNVDVEAYLAGDWPADTTILHILLGEGVPPGSVQKVFHKALRSSRRVLVLEHDGTSRDWTMREGPPLRPATETERLLRAWAAGRPAVFSGTRHLAGEADLQRNALWVIDVEQGVAGASVPPSGTGSEGAGVADSGGLVQCAETHKNFRVLAIIAAYNEADVISHVIGDLIANGIDVYLLDHGSTDGTVAEASRWLGKGLVHIERFPQDCGYPERDTRQYVWHDILRRKTEIAAEIPADWYLHTDADEFREAPWPDMSLSDAIRVVDRLGYNAITFEVLNFCATDDGFVPGSDVRNHLRHFRPADECDRAQIKVWKRTGVPITLERSGGHEVEFAGRRVFPIPFILRHYPIRGETHGRQKLLADRQPRFAPEELAMGWHVQYQPLLTRERPLLEDPARLTAYDPSAVRARLLARATLDLLPRADAAPPDAAVNPAEAGVQFGFGFHADEGGWRWMSEAGMIAVWARDAEARQELLLTVTCGEAACYDPFPFAVTISAGQTLLTQVRFEQSCQQHTIAVPLPERAGTGQYLLLRSGSSYVPRALGVGGDDRRLSVRVGPVHLRPASAASASDDAVDLGAADRALHSEAWGEACQGYIRILQRDRNCAAARSGLGLGLMALGETEEGLAQLQEAVRIKASPDLVSNLACGLMHVGRLEEAGQLLESILAGAPGHEAAQENLRRLRRACASDMPAGVVRPASNASAVAIDRVKGVEAGDIGDMPQDLAQAIRVQASNGPRLPGLSTHLLVRNEAELIDLYLDNTLPYVDELIIIDGGSTDGTLGRIRARGSDKIRLFVWPQQGPQFSAGWREPDRRNAAIALTGREWILKKDADEFFREADYAWIRTRMAGRRDRIVCFPRLNFWADVDHVRLDTDGDPHWFPDHQGNLWPAELALRWTDVPLHCQLARDGVVFDRTEVCEAVPIYHYHWALGNRVKANDLRRGDLVADRKCLPPEVEDRAVESGHVQWDRPGIRVTEYRGRHPAAIEQHLARVRAVPLANAVPGAAGSYQATCLAGRGSVSGGGGGRSGPV